MNIRIYLFCLIVFCTQCSKNESLQTAVVSLEFSHVWDGNAVTDSDFNEIKFATKNGDTLSIERLRYLISDITFTHEDGTQTTLDEYYLIDLSKPNSLSIQLSQNIPTGNYTTLNFRFGFADEDNVDGAYPDLNTASWNVPSMLGGGYHYLQFDGKYVNTEGNTAPFNYHMIRAVDRSDPENLILQDTSFEVSLGNVSITKDGLFSIEVNLAEWFKNPYTWDLNMWNTVLMPNTEAQLKMHENGPSVFQLKNTSL